MVSENRISRRTAIKRGSAGAAAVALTLGVGLAPVDAANDAGNKHANQAGDDGTPEGMLRLKFALSDLAYATRELRSTTSRVRSFDVSRASLPAHEAIDAIIAASLSSERAADEASPYFCAGDPDGRGEGSMCYDPSWAHVDGECVGGRDDHGHHWGVYGVSTFSRHGFIPAMYCPNPMHDLPGHEEMQLPDCSQCHGHAMLLVQPDGSWRTL
jgi:hypothetical protein